MIITKEICNQLNDIELVQKVMTEIDYFSCIYERYEPKLLRYVKRITGVSNEEAEDILQEAFLKIWRNINSYDTDLKFSTWIYRVVHNETISYWRKQSSFGKDHQIDLDENFPEEFDSNSQPGDSNKNVLTHEILELLPLKYKTILVLKFLEGMDYDEISDILKIPPGTVATRINRAKKAFSAISEQMHISFFE
ncbi:MAG: RNA polymerase sigma factor [Bacteroidia bacterium]